MADIKISQLGEALAVTDNDILPMTASGVTSKVKASTMKSYMVDDLDVSDLHDTNITTLADNDGLVYDATAQKWKNKPVVTGDLWVQNGAHNLLDSSVTTQTINGVVFTVTRVNGLITEIDANGTVVDNNAQLFLRNRNSDYLELPVGSYIGSGCPSGGSDDTYHVRFIQTIDNQAVEFRDYGNGVEFNVTNVNHMGVTIYIKLGTTVNHKKFYPMIRLSTDTDPTYAPYAKTNRELTEKIDAYAKYNLYDYSTNGCTVYATGVRIGNMAVLQGKWYKSAGLAGGTDYITSLPSDLIPSEDMTGSGILVRQSDGSIEPSLPKVTTTGVVYESSTGDVLTTGSFSIVYRVK